MRAAPQPQVRRVGDLVIWDNRCTMHRGTDFDDLRWTRNMRRSTVSDVGNTLEQDVGVDAARLQAEAS